MKRIAIALALGLMGASAASAQSLTIDTNGPRITRDRDYDRGDRWDRGDRFDRRDGWERRVERRDRYRNFETGSVDCRVTTIRKRNADGDVVVRRIRRCD